MPAGITIENGKKQPEIQQKHETRSLTHVGDQEPRYSTGG